MQENVANKALVGKGEKVEVKKKFFFPDHQVTVEAETQEEAERALAKKVKSS